MKKAAFAAFFISAERETAEAACLQSVIRPHRDRHGGGLLSHGYRAVRRIRSVQTEG
ncbi:hypothetical protein [Tahibacter sp.]|uniref:hypothetical protein n=1 Tax=Tahibacter sp. TaxID=2056211 RepID=UPI0028C4A748|nr:hypothetical protein [Tahibacter sp.]